MSAPLEGVSCGSWREKSLEALKKDMDTSIRKTASNQVGFYSFNSNYYSQYIDLLHEASERYSTFSIINMRVDVISGCKDYVDAAKALGVFRMSMPIEGFGERVRNKVLNKTLSFDQIKEAFKIVLSAGMIELKIGMILTGQETAEDMENAAQEFEELYQIKEDLNVGLSMRCNVTPLVHYPHCGVAWMPQNTSLVSYHNLKTMTSLLKRLRGKIRFKFNGRNFGTFCEQTALNMGRLGTPFFKKFAKDGYHFYGPTGKDFAHGLVKYCQGLGLDYFDLLKEKPKEWIFPVDHMPKQSEEYVEKMRLAAGKKSMPPCVETPVNKKPKCYECGYCKTKEEKKSILRRDFTNEHVPADLQLSRYKNKAMAAYRVTFNKPKNLRFVGYKALSFRTAAHLLEINDEAFSNFHSIKNVSNYLMEKGGLRDWFHGTGFFDIHMKAPFDFTPEVMKAWQDTLVDTTLVSVVPVDIRQRHPDTSSLVSIVKVKGVGLSEFKEKYAMRPKHTIKVGSVAKMSSSGVGIEDKPLRHPFSVQAKPYSGGLMLAIHHSIQYNPYLIVMDILKLSYKKVMERSDTKFVGWFGLQEGVCKCGKGKHLSLTNSKEVRFCTSCISKAYLKLLSSAEG